MECAEARNLIDRGIPTIGRRQQAVLDHHITGCADCAAYLARADAAMLTTLLGQDARRNPYETRTLRQPVVLAPIRRAPSPAATRAPRRWLQIMVATIGILLMLAALRIAAPLLALRQSVAAMTMPTTTPALAIPPVVLPTAQQAVPLQVTTIPTPSEPIRSAPLPTPTAAGWPTAAAIATLTATFTPQPVVPIAPLLLAGPTLMPIAPPGAAPAAGKAVNILLLGVDRRPGETAPVRADTVIVLRLDPERQRAALLSLPRDLVVSIPNFGFARINAAHAHGEVIYGPGGGITLTRQTVGQLLNIPIDYVVQVDFSGFIAGIDAIGGITIDVPTALYDGQYPTMDYGYQEVSFAPGTQQMDGARALVYARIRHGDSDIERMRRQQLVMLAALGRVRGQNMFGQLDASARLASSLRSYVRFDIPEDRLVSLIWAFREAQPAAIERYTLDANMMQMFVLPDDPYAAFALPGAIEELTANLMGT